MNEMKFEHGRIYRFSKKTLLRQFNRNTANYVYLKSAKNPPKNGDASDWIAKDFDERGGEFEYIGRSGKMYQFREIHGLWTRSLSINQLIGLAIFVRAENGDYELFSI